MFDSKVKLYDYLQLFGKQFKMSCQIKMNGFLFFTHTDLFTGESSLPSWVKSPGMEMRMSQYKVEL